MIVLKLLKEKKNEKKYTNALLCIGHWIEMKLNLPSTQRLIRTSKDAGFDCTKEQLNPTDVVAVRSAS